MYQKFQDNNRVGHQVQRNLPQNTSVQHTVRVQVHAVHGNDNRNGLERQLKTERVQIHVVYGHENENEMGRKSQQQKKFNAGCHCRRKIR